MKIRFHKFTFLFFTVILSITLTCCYKQETPIPKELISEDTLINILTDAQIIEASKSVYLMKGHDPEKTANIQYALVLEKYQVTLERVKFTLDWYHSHPLLSKPVYDKVLENLITTQSALQQEKGKNIEGE